MWAWEEGVGREVGHSRVRGRKWGTRAEADAKPRELGIDAERRGQDSGLEEITRKMAALLELIFSDFAVHLPIQEGVQRLLELL